MNPPKAINLVNFLVPEKMSFWDSSFLIDMSVKEPAMDLDETVTQPRLNLDTWH